MRSIYKENGAAVSNLNVSEIRLSVKSYLHSDCADAIASSTLTNTSPRSSQSDKFSAASTCTWKRLRVPLKIYRCSHFTQRMNPWLTEWGQRTLQNYVLSHGRRSHKISTVCYKSLFMTLNQKQCSDRDTSQLTPILWPPVILSLKVTVKETMGSCYCYKERERERAVRCD